MKKLLLGTSAFAAAGLFYNGAFAQTAPTDQPIQLKIGGQYYAGAAALVQQDDNPGEVGYKRNPVSVQEYFLIRFIGSTTFSNGITAGIWTRLNAFSAPNGTVATSSGFQSSNNTTIKDSYVYLKNSAVWGEFRLGDDQDARRSFAVGTNAGAANGDGNLGANSGTLQWLNTPVYNFTSFNLDSRGTKAAYYTPTIAGFQFAATFAPDKAGGHTNGPSNVGDNSGLTDRITNGLTPSYQNNQSAYNYISLAGSWTGTFGPTKIATTLGYSTASRKCGVNSNITTALGTAAGPVNCSILGTAGTQNADPRVLNAGMQLNYGPWELGTDWERTQAIPGGVVAGGGAGQATAFNAAGAATSFAVKTNQMINNQLDVNLSYTIGAFRLGAEYSRGSFEGITGDANVKRAAIQNEIQIGGTYTVGPGVALIGMLQEALYDANGKYVPLATGVQNIYAKDSNSTAIIFETSLRF